MDQEKMPGSGPFTVFFKPNVGDAGKRPRWKPVYRAETEKAAWEWIIAGTAEFTGSWRVDRPATAEEKK